MSSATLDSSAIPSRLTHFATQPKDGEGVVWGVYACACGWLGKKRVKDVNRGAIRSCGCLRRALVGQRSSTHGHAKNRAPTPTLKVWNAMWARCRDQNGKRWAQYGGRGITVCARWKDFGAFLADMGERPVGKTIERKDNDKGYFPGNCVWASHIEQIYNRTVTLRHDWQGRTWTTKELSEVNGVPPKHILNRLRMGWSVERAATTAMRAGRPRNERRH